jgi:hypothetical protein
VRSVIDAAGPYEIAEPVKAARVAALQLRFGRSIADLLVPKRVERGSATRCSTHLNIEIGGMGALGDDGNEVN